MVSLALSKGVDEERVRAMQLLLSLGDRIGRELACGSTDRIMIEGMKNYVIMTSSGYKTAMNIRTKLNAKLGLIFLDIECALEALMKLMG